MFASVERWRDRIVLHLSDADANGVTVEIDVKTARKLARYLDACANDINGLDYNDSTFITCSIEG